MSFATNVRQAIWGLTPDEQKNRRHLRGEMRKLENNKRNMKMHEQKSIKHLRETTKKLQKRGIDPSKDPAIRKLALGIVRAQTQQKRLETSTAQMNSIMVQFQSNKSIEVMEESMKQATGILKSANTQIKIPEMMAATQNFEAERMKAETYEEMVEDMMDPIDQGEDEETEDELSEVNKLLNSILGRPESKVADAFESANVDVPVDEEENEEIMDEQMRGRMQALRSS